jgi:carotenoid cleavage dioxygenase-like enzyme
VASVDPTEARKIEVLSRSHMIPVDAVRVYAVPQATTSRPRSLSWVTEGGGTVDAAAQVAAQVSTNTAKLASRIGDEVTRGKSWWKLRRTWRMSEPRDTGVPDRYFAPVPDEITARDLPVAGTLPPALNGLYLRNGPNPRPGSPLPFIAGDGMIHGVRLEAGQARWYRNRYVKTRRDAGRRGGASSNTHVFAHAGHILSFVEVALPVEIDRELETIGPFDFGGIDTAFTAHGKIDPVTGELLAFGYQFADPHLTFYRIDRAGRIAERRAIGVSHACLMHDFATTENHVLFFDTPTVMVQDWGRGGLPFQWHEGRPTRLGIVPRNGGAERWFDVAACQVTHTANAFERDDRIVVDGIRINRFPPNMAADPPVLYRWEIDLARGLVAESPLDEHAAEFPRIDDRRNGRPYRYAYTVEYGEIGPGDLPRTAVLRRYDLDTGNSIAKDFGDRYMPGEPVFIPKSAESAEDDGWVLAFRYDRERDRSDLVVLDANDFGGDPIGVVQLPGRVPCGLHGSWVAD